MSTTKETIDSLMQDQLVATDEGTHGRPETVRVYERLDGERYAVKYSAGVTIGNCRAESIHGTLRWLKVLSPAQRREKINHLKAVEIQKAKASDRAAARRESLSRGWDGYQFVGVEEGQ